MNRGRILHFEDNASDAFLIGHWLSAGGIDADVTLASDADSYRSCLTSGEYDLVLADSSVPGMAPLEALHLARQLQPDAPFVCLSGSAEENNVKAMLAAGAADYVLKDHEWRLIAVAQRELRVGQDKREQRRMSDHMRATRRLVRAVQDLASAPSLASVATIVRSAAREIAAADGATFVLREGDYCHYLAEDAVAPLWKGSRFPITSCISGWSMLRGQPAMIEDVLDDARVLPEVYRPTFVKSLLMLPIRRTSPVGAIGVYWARRHRAEPHETELLQALAETVAMAMENTSARSELEQRLQDRSRQLEVVQRELDAFSSAVCAQLQAPLQAIRAATEIVGGDAADYRARLEQARVTGESMERLVAKMLELAKISRAPLHARHVDLAAIARSVVEDLRTKHPDRLVNVEVDETMPAVCDADLLATVFENLLDNAWKYAGNAASPHIRIGCEMQYDGSKAYFVRDNGVGFDMKQAGRLFAPFERLHDAREFPGDGTGLAVVQRIIHKHGGRLWARASFGNGATFYFTIADPVSAPSMV